jgi:lipopolysaccharide export system protein LptA
MSPVRDLVAVAFLAGMLATATAAEPSRPGPAPLAVPGLRRDQPITVTSQTLEFDYKSNVVVYRGDVHAAQGDVRLRSDELIIRLVSADQKKNGSDHPTKGAGDDQAKDAPTKDGPTKDAPTKDAQANPSSGGDTFGGRTQLRKVEATGHVRIDQGDRWATGGRADFDQEKRILVLSEDPVLHDGPNQIVGDRVIVYLDENRSVVEGGDKRVKAVLFPDHGQTPGAGAAPTP